VGRATGSLRGAQIDPRGARSCRQALHPQPWATIAQSSISRWTHQAPLRAACSLTSPAARAATAGTHVIVQWCAVTEDCLWPIVTAKRAGLHRHHRKRRDHRPHLQPGGTGPNGSTFGRPGHVREDEACKPSTAPGRRPARRARRQTPFRDIGWLDSDHRAPDAPDYLPAWPTDWYYGDLDSDWDTDGDGYFGEFLGCPPGDTRTGGDTTRIAPGGQPGRGTLRRAARARDDARRFPSAACP
jgi:hypothetical protein